MARYIDADELYKATQKRIAEANEARMAVVDDEFLDLINDAFTEDVAPRAEWISVRERLPDNCRAVLVAVEGLTIGGAPAMVIGSYSGGFWMIADADGTHYLTKYMRYVVNHWMPLPEPPKEIDTSEHILSLSYGKDSLACLGAIEALGWPLGRIVHAEVWATDTIPADLPPMVEFKAKADRIIKERWGIEVEHRRAKVTFEEQFYRVRKSKTTSAMKIYGFPIVNGAWCNSKLKMAVIPKLKSGDVSYIGIAADEPNRFHNLTETKRSPLVEAGWTEAMCRKWCEDNDLLSPIYTTATRGGCWFCHNQGVDQLRLLRRDYPEYWALLMKWDLDSTVTFKPDGHTVHDFDRRFALEDEGIVNPIHPFRWAMLDGDVQLRF